MHETQDYGGVIYTSLSGRRPAFPVGATDFHSGAKRSASAAARSEVRRLDAGVGQLDGLY